MTTATATTTDYLAMEVQAYSGLLEDCTGFTVHIATDDEGELCYQLTDAYGDAYGGALVRVGRRGGRDPLRDRGPAASHGVLSHATHRFDPRSRGPDSLGPGGHRRPAAATSSSTSTAGRPTGDCTGRRLCPG